MSFPTELDAFRAYVKTFPKNPTLLIDTYDTLDGAKNAVQVAKELEEKAYQLGAVRIDSGNLAELAKQVREVLNDNNLRYVRIVASNDLNEYKIDALKKAGAPIDAYGVGTEMITAKPVAAIPGVYKLVQDSEGPKIKLSSEKITYPGVKQVYRVQDKNENYIKDILALEDEEYSARPLLEKVVENGERIRKRRTLEDTKAYCLEEVAKLPETARGLNAVPYQMTPSLGLLALVETLKQTCNGGKLR
jgi:nicotinate phosphoribosyltransferase